MFNDNVSVIKDARGPIREKEHVHSLYKIGFDPQKIIGHFGGDDGAIAALDKIGMKVKRKLLQKQRERGNIPADMVACLAVASVKEGRPIDLYACLLNRDEQPDGKGTDDDPI